MRNRPGQRSMRLHQFNHPIHEHPQPSAHMTVGRKRDIQRHRRNGPVLKQRRQFTPRQMRRCSFDDVVDVTVFVVDPEKNFERIWQIVPDYWGNAPYPTLTGIGVTWLYGFQFEIKVIAKLPS